MISGFFKKLFSAAIFQAGKGDVRFLFVLFFIKFFSQFDNLHSFFFCHKTFTLNQFLAQSVRSVIIQTIKTSPNSPSKDILMNFNTFFFQFIFSDHGRWMVEGASKLFTTYSSGLNFEIKYLSLFYMAPGYTHHHHHIFGKISIEMKA